MRTAVRRPARPRLPADLIRRLRRSPPLRRDARRAAALPAANPSSPSTDDQVGTRKAQDGAVPRRRQRRSWAADPDRTWSFSPRGSRAILTGPARPATPTRSRPGCRPASPREAALVVAAAAQRSPRADRCRRLHPRPGLRIDRDARRAICDAAAAGSRLDRRREASSGGSASAGRAWRGSTSARTYARAAAALYQRWANRGDRTVLERPGRWPA